jgi:small subunit ribosomal protein S9
MTSDNTSVYYYGTGKRKTAVAQVRLYPEGSAIAINGRTIEEAIPWEPWREEALTPLKVVNMLGKFSVVAKIRGGGISAWSDALRHGIARALVVYDPSYRSTLRSYGLLTRDDRIKEPKKYGLKRARRAPQYTKR